MSTELNPESNPNVESLPKLSETLQIIQRDIASMHAELKEFRDELKVMMSLVTSSHHKMNQHVDFVENVYSSVRHPLNFVKRRIDSLMGNSPTTLPQLESHLATTSGNTIGIAPHNADSA